MEKSLVTTLTFDKKKRKKKGNTRLEKMFIISMIGIPLIHWLVFYLYVNLNSILMAFQIPTGDWSMESLRGAVVSLATSGSQMRIAIRNTLLYFTQSLFMLFFNTVVAYYLYKRIKGYKAFRIILYMPGIVSGVAIATMFKNFITPQGPLGILLSKLGVDPVPEFMADSRYATLTMLLYNFWLGWGGNMLLLGGCLERIPVDMLESARIDGIGAFKEFFLIIVPLIWTTLSTLLILTLTGLFGASGPILLFTQGAFETTTIGYWIFDKVAFQGASAYNEVAATGLIFTAIGVPLIMTAKWLIEKIPTVEY